MKPIHESNRTGDIAEYYAVTYLWDLGFEVFKNAGCTGAVDLIALSKEGDIIYIDVKTDTESDGSGVSSLTDKQKELGVNLLIFDKHTRQFRFMEHRHETTYSRYRDKHSTQYSLDLCN